MKNVSKFFIKAFSLVELMISLITVSLVSAAFAPVITKKLTKNTLTIASSKNASNTIECNSTCATCSTSIDNCTSCKGGYYLNETNCVTCPLNAICSGGITDFICEQYYTKDNDRCKRTLCPTGEYLSDETCLKCPENGVCNGVSIICNSGYQLVNQSCVAINKKPVCANSSNCVFSGNIDGDWMLTIKDTTMINFESSVNVDIFAVGGGGGGGMGMGCSGAGGYTSTTLNRTLKGRYKAEVGAGGWSGYMSNGGSGGTTNFYNSSTLNSCINAKGGGGGTWGSNCVNGSGGTAVGQCDGRGGQGTTTKAFGENSGNPYANGACSGCWGAGKCGDRTTDSSSTGGSANTGSGGGSCWYFDYCFGSPGGSGVILIRNAKCSFCDMTPCAGS